MVDWHTSNHIQHIVHEYAQYVQYTGVHAQYVQNTEYKLAQYE
jgi:hypothetical protein